MADGGSHVGRRPAIRAHQTQNLLQLVPRLSVHREEVFRTKVRPGLIEQTRTYRTMSWVPMGEHMHLCDALWETVGRRQFVALFREAFVGSMRIQPLRQLFGLFRTISPNSVAIVLRNASRIYSYVTRDVGQLEYRQENGRRGVLTMQGWPSQHFSYKCWIDGTEGCIIGAMEAVGAGPNAEVTVDDCDEVAGSAAFRVQW